MLGGCALPDSAHYTNYREDVAGKARVLSKGPANAPSANLTSFASGLQCMDNLFITYGIRDVSIMIEDVPDQTRKVNAGARDMLVSAVSQMSRRSQAIRLVPLSAGPAFGLNATLANNVLTRPDAPEFFIQGSISQFDESLVRKQGDAGVVVSALTASAARQGSASNLGLDLHLLRLRGMSLVPGVTSKNSVLVSREGSGLDGELSLSKFGLSYNFTLSQTEGMAQALRTLTELAAIELLGRLNKIPYWTCLGVTEKDASVALELTDWWEAFAANPDALVGYLQKQMTRRGIYTGAVSGQVNDELIHAVQIYQTAMGMPGSANLNFEFFRRYLTTNHFETQPRAQALLAQRPFVAAQEPAPQAPAAKAPVPHAQPSSTPIVPVLVTGGSAVYRRGENYEFDVSVAHDAFLYCFLFDEAGKVNRFFPNPVQREPWVKAGTRLRFPGSLPLRFVANLRAAPETVSCIASRKPADEQLLSRAQSVPGNDELIALFSRAGGELLGSGRYDVRIH